MHLQNQIQRISNDIKRRYNRLDPKDSQLHKTRIDTGIQRIAKMRNFQKDPQLHQKWAVRETLVALLKMVFNRK